VLVGLIRGKTDKIKEDLIYATDLEAVFDKKLANKIICS
jgi:hypothetical protein